MKLQLHNMLLALCIALTPLVTNAANDDSSGAKKSAGSAKSIKIAKFKKLRKVVQENVGRIEANEEDIDAMESRLDDHETRINALEATPVNPVFGGYGTPLAADGAAKNVVVLSTPREDGGAFYWARIAYANSTEAISVNGMPVVPPYIFKYAFAYDDVSGILQAVSSSIEAPDTPAYYDYYVEEAEYDPVSLVKTVTADDERESWLCGGSDTNTQLCLSTVTLSATGEFSRSYSWNQARALAEGPLTVNGMTFDDVRYRVMLNRDNFRAEAKGIGLLKLVTLEGRTRDLIYYRVDGNTGGSLVGTPFAPGEPLDGLFF